MFVYQPVSGPLSYVVNASDRRTINPDNKPGKFADYTYLLVPSVNSCSCKNAYDVNIEFIRVYHVYIKLIRWT